VNLEVKDSFRQRARALAVPGARDLHRELEANVLGLLLVVVLILVLIGALPAWPHSRHWGYFPAGGLGLVLVIVVVLVFMGRI
jgi:hypothetical protein